MAYTLTQDLITEPQPAVAGMCLADWQALDDFDVDQHRRRRQGPR